MEVSGRLRELRGRKSVISQHLDTKHVMKNAARKYLRERAIALGAGGLISLKIDTPVPCWVFGSPVGTIGSGIKG
jgi:hypothetical protein